MITGERFFPIGLKTLSVVFAAFFLSLLAGCQSVSKEILTVDFQKDQTLRYKFVSSRDIEINWGSMETSKSSKHGSEVKKSSESAEMIVSYTPVEITPGLTTIKATCESVQISRDSQLTRRATSQDAVESLTGRTFTFTVDAAGRIKDYSQLEALIMEAGEKAFKLRDAGNRIKEPDMIGDFIATQWFLWNPVASIKKPVQGVSLGQTWNSKLSVPLPMVLKQSRDVTYKLQEIRDSNAGRIAVITSTYVPAKSTATDWPLPYTGGFQMTGTFGFLRNYKLIHLQGTGRELYNIDKGRTEQYDQQFETNFEAELALPLGTNPKISIKQTLTMQLLDSPLKN